MATPKKRPTAKRNPFLDATTGKAGTIKRATHKDPANKGGGVGAAKRKRKGTTTY
jgi:hypothetical protein